MQIQFIGAVKTTTGSMHLVQVNGTRVLLDCGLYQGKRKEAFERNRNLPFSPQSIHACVLSHAHVDHSGNLPTLARGGFQGPIFATPATRDLCEIMLLDSAHLQARDVLFVNKKRIKQGKHPFEPLYEAEHVMLAMEQFSLVPYETPTEIPGGLTLTFHDAGHILGSALVSLDVRENGRLKKLFFTGDLGRKDMPILRDPTQVRNADFVITESTYGDRLHAGRDEIKSRLELACQDICSRQSKLIIPAFSVGRTQQVLYFVNQLFHERKVSEIPVYVDSPLSSKATQIYRAHRECFDEETREWMREGIDPFSFPWLHYLTETEESKRLNTATGPIIIISASGMCEAGRILHHLANSILDERNIILIVGFQAEHTLGRRLVERMSPVRILGDEYRLRAEVRKINALSAHADRAEILSYLSGMVPGVRSAFAVHGEPNPAESLAQGLRDLGVSDVTVPDPNQTVKL